MMKKIVLLSVLAIISACSNDKSYNDNSYNVANGQYGGAGGVNGDPNDPQSIAYLYETIGNTILFPVNQATLSNQARALLSRQLQWILSSNNMITIEGHADEQGTREYNLALGARRAAAVRDYFLANGVPASRMSVLTYGKERPLAVCSTEECWAKNRRAVTIVK